MPHYKQPNKGMKRLDISTGAGEGGGVRYTHFVALQLLLKVAFYSVFQKF